MKLDPAALRYLTDDDFRVLTAVELGMRNHELVPIPLISVISGLRHGGYMKSLKEIHKNKLVHKETKRYVGYRLTTLGYDYLALRALVKRGVIHSIGRSLGVGKEADVFLVSATEELLDAHPDLEMPHLAMKLHRLGRTSFRAVKNKRDYLVHRKSASWIYFSRLAAMKEYAFMCALHSRGFPVPRPLGQSRHVVVMELCPGSLLNQVMELPDPLEVVNTLLAVVVRLAQHGLVHCDLNEFNVMIDDDSSVTVIDFPQMVSICHADAEMLFNRDVEGLTRFFSHRFGVIEEQMHIPDFQTVIHERDDEDQLDTMVSASGFKNDMTDGFYGFQDLGENDVAEEKESIDPKSLQSIIREPEEDSNDNVEREAKPESGCPAREQGLREDCCDGRNCEDDVSYELEEDCSSQVSTIDKSLIEARVRKQRSNQNQRRQLSKRNTVKDSEKRKVKVEMDCGVWQ